MTVNSRITQSDLGAKPFPIDGQGVVMLFHNGTVVHGGSGSYRCLVGSYYTDLGMKGYSDFNGKVELS